MFTHPSGQNPTLKQNIVLAVFSLVIPAILVAIGIGVFSESPPHDLAATQFGFEFHRQLVGISVASLGIMLLVFSQFSQMFRVSFGRALTFVMVGLSFLSMSGLFGIAAIFPIIAEAYFESNRPKSGDLKETDRS